MRYFIRISFDGTAYHGWQVQQNAISVQAVLNKAISTYLHSEIETTGCGRTDTGVHARIFYAHFDAVELIVPPDEIVHHLNCILPHDIAVHEVLAVQPDAHTRYDAISRTYEYRLYQSKNPFLRKTAYYFPSELDVNFMNHLAKVLQDYSDFSCFSKSNTQTLTNICHISEAAWKWDGEELIFKITADRFLRNMVRAIVGTLLNAGVHKLSETEFRNILNSNDRKEAGVSVPAHGLYLCDIKYPYL